MKLLAGNVGVVRLHGSYEDEAHITLVMEYCASGDLFKMMLMHGGVLDEHWVATEVSWLSGTAARARMSAPHLVRVFLVYHHRDEAPTHRMCGLQHDTVMCTPCQFPSGFPVRR